MTKTSMKTASVPALLISMPLVFSEMESSIYSSEISRLYDLKQDAMSVASTVSQFINDVMGALVNSNNENPTINGWQASEEEENAEDEEISEDEIRAKVIQWRDMTRSKRQEAEKYIPEETRPSIAIYPVEEKDATGYANLIDCNKMFENYREDSVPEQKEMEEIAATNVDPVSLNDESPSAYALPIFRIKVRLISSQELDSESLYDSQPLETSRGLRHGQP
uniref:AlNc14C199G8636 protein n=1 Tax=Albugo laibachii Nc14 TaxID=890382 RepID=F0WQG5_9STRA|nr:AlNc14C199G8636 [Albugo laibachii Nc14]|eukprot:CCA23574.1 AlNc14C199G8636 [Albugo laibachii Nc14]